MKIKVVLASSSRELVRSQIANWYNSLAPETEIMIVALSQCPASTQREVYEVFVSRNSSLKSSR